MMNRIHLIECVIRPTLIHMSVLNSSLNSKAAENLLLGTILQESAGGRYLKQIKGPALGIFQIEPATHKDVFENFLKHRPDWETHIVKLASRGFYGNRDDELMFNLRYACAIARLVYWRSPVKMPDHDDVVGLGEMWKVAYNTKHGRGTAEEFINNYQTSGR